MQNRSHSLHSPLSAQNLQKYKLQRPEDIFTLSYFEQNPEPFFKLSKELIPDKLKYAPSITHYFIRLLAEKGLLLRHYTQNIDGLEVECGLQESLCVEAHGHFRSGTCQQCRAPYGSEMFVPLILRDEIPKCRKSECDGVVKPNVVFFGEALPERFWETLSSDFKKCDMLIIMGTSLMVHPFAGLIERVNDECPRMLINMDPVAMSVLKDEHRDYFLGGTCDDGVRKFAAKMGWKDELERLREHDLKETVEDEKQSQAEQDNAREKQMIVSSM